MCVCVRVCVHVYIYKVYNILYYLTTFDVKD
jgi:hypothetical protein